MSTDNQQEQALLQQLRANGDPTAQREAAQLQQLYHDREMAGLATDVYDAAKSSGHPPSGWMRLSEHPELLNQYAPQLHISDLELKRMLHPDESGFRAEIYLPDPKILGPGYEPVMAFKGSSGEVMTSHGLRDTTQEDFLANNFPQSIGLKTDYYDRAMGMAMLFKQQGMDFELTGHSLAGGMASAASAVTGMPATTFNAAGLNPETARAYAQNHPGVTVYHDLERRITAYQVQGELLNDGVQGNIHRMDVAERAELGGVLKETSQLLNRLPEGRAVLARQLDSSVPPWAQASVHAFVDKVANGNADQLLHDLPLAAGRVQPPLEAMTRADLNNPASPLVARAHTPSLPEVTYLAKPVLETASILAAGAHVGERGGTAVAYGGQFAQQVMHGSGEGVRNLGEIGGQLSRATTHLEGMAAQAGEHYLGGGAARLREGAAEAHARLDQGWGRLQQFDDALSAGVLHGVGRALPANARAWMDAHAAPFEQAGEEANRQGQARAAEVRREGREDAAAIRSATRSLQSGTGYAADQTGNFQHDVIAGSGRLVGSGLDGTGRTIEGVTRHAPTAGAAVGALAATPGALTMELTPANFPRLEAAAIALGYGKQAGIEATDRHLMRPTVLPSMDGRIAKTEEAARATLRHTAPAPAHPENDPRNPGDPKHAQYEKLRGQIADAYDRNGLALGHEQLDRITARVMYDAQKSQLKDIKEVRLNPDPATHQVGPHSLLLAFSGNPADVTTRKSITDVQQAQQTPAAQSFHQLGQLTQQQAQVHAQLQLHQQQPQLVQPGLHAPAMAGR